MKIGVFLVDLDMADIDHDSGEIRIKTADCEWFHIPDDENKYVANAYNSCCTFGNLSASVRQLLQRSCKHDDSTLFDNGWLCSDCGHVEPEGNSERGDPVDREDTQEIVDFLAESLLQRKGDRDGYKCRSRIR